MGEGKRKKKNREGKDHARNEETELLKTDSLFFLAVENAKIYIMQGQTTTAENLGFLTSKQSNFISKE